jgi:integrase/recombinase XerC
LNSQGLVEAKILARIIHPKMPNKLMFALSQQELNSFFSSIDSSSSIGKRNLAIIELLYGAGLRVSELCGLKLSDIDFDQKILKVLEKVENKDFLPLITKHFRRLKTIWVKREFLRKIGQQNMSFLIGRYSAWC